MTKSYISIIVPIYNVESFLDECLKSIYAVKNESIEVILVNDGSTDGSLQIAERYLASYPLVTKIINKKNGGLSSARNCGLDAATGEWVYFLDSDDFIDPVAFARVLEKTIMTDADIVAFTGFLYYEEEQKKLNLHAKENPFLNQGIIDSKIYLSQMLRIGSTNIVISCDKFYRLSHLNKMKLRFIEGIFHEDVPFTFKLLVGDSKIEFIKEHVLYYRQRSGSIMNSRNPKKAFDKLIIIKTLIELTTEHTTDKNINGYIVHLIRTNIKSEVTIPLKTFYKVFLINLSLKKRLILLYCLLMSLSQLTLGKLGLKN